MEGKTTNRHVFLRMVREVEMSRDWFRSVLRIENIQSIKILLLLSTPLPTTSVRNLWKHERRICDLILGLLKG